jgi:hypothetical protein
MSDRVISEMYNEGSEEHNASTFRAECKPRVEEMVLVQGKGRSEYGHKRTNRSKFKGDRMCGPGKDRLKRIEGCGK